MPSGPGFVISSLRKMHLAKQLESQSRLLQVHGPPKSALFRSDQPATAQKRNKGGRNAYDLHRAHSLKEIEPQIELGTTCTGRRAALWASAAVLLLPLSAPAAENSSNSEPGFEETSNSVPPDTTITNKVYLDIGVCQEGVRANRTLGDNAFCTSPQPLGRVVIGLYGKQVPNTVQNFLTFISKGIYNSTLFNKVLPGEYIQAGKQGSPRMGEVSVSVQLPPNKDLVSPRAYSLSHERAGTVSLNLSHNDDDPLMQQSRSYRNASFLITTGPGPASSLDGTNVVFGKVLEGMDTISRVASVQTFKPVNDRLLALNRLGSMLGDERAAKTRKKWGTPLKPVLITDSGVIA